MEIKERIDNCLAALEQKQHSVAVFEAKLRSLIESLKANGMKSGKLSELLQTLESVLRDYSEIGMNCRNIVEGLRGIGSHVDHIENGRKKILDGVDSILENLSHLDHLAKSGMQVGATTGKSPKRILLVRVQPGESASRLKEDDENEDPAGDTVVH